MGGNGGPEALTSESFGYDDVNKRFKPPPAHAVPDLIIFASRGVSDTGDNLVEQTVSPPVLGTNGGLQVVSSRFAETITFNEDLGFRVNKSLPGMARNCQFDLGGGRLQGLSSVQLQHA